MIHRVRIEKIIAGGFGLGRLASGQVVLTRFVLPGETVLVREIARHRGYLEALPSEIVEASSCRATPACPYFTLCGGCGFQHIDIPTQHRIKTEIIRESLERAGIQVNDSVLHTIIPSPQPFHYRFRVRLKVKPDGQSGFYRSGSNELVPVERCLLATERINDALREVNCSEQFRKLAADLREIELVHSPADDRVFAILHLRRDAASVQTRFDALAASFNTINNCLIKKEKKPFSPHGGLSPAVLSQQFGSGVCGRSFTLSWDPECFFQVNTTQNERLIALVRQEFLNTGGKKVLELYCGMGNFSIPLALSGAEMTCIEQNRDAVRRAKLNAQQCGVTSCTFQTGDAGRCLHGLVSTSERYDVVLLDPPRQGLGSDTRALASLEPKNIIYVSCDPATLARDLAILTGRGYIPISLTPVDMFPQTHHIEAVVLLEKN